MNIEELSNNQLLSHFEDAICEHHYNPSSNSYNKSEFTLEELRSEILNRMPKIAIEEDEC